MKWFRLVAKRGGADGQFFLGVMYLQGAGVPTNYVKAHAWWSMAAANGNEEASNLRELVAKGMTPQQIAEAQAYAARCVENDYEGCD